MYKKKGKLRQKAIQQLNPDKIKNLDFMKEIIFPKNYIDERDNHFKLFDRHYHQMLYSRLKNLQNKNKKLYLNLKKHLRKLAYKEVLNIKFSFPKDYKNDFIE